MKTQDKIYVSWNGEIYGPSKSEDIAAGIRAAWFEEGTLYWHEGLDQWRPLAEFPLKEAPPPGGHARLNPKDLPVAPSLPVAPEHGGSVERRVRRKRSAGSAEEELGRKGWTAVAIYALLAAALTVLILLLLMLV